MLWLKRSMPTLQANKPKDRHTPPLSARLSAIAEGLPRGGVVCDVGSDHGALPLHMLKSGACSGAVVTDLNPMPLARAKSNLVAAGVDHKAEFILTDGIPFESTLHPDSFVIAGMGGETVSGILERALPTLEMEAFFALQPMTRPEQLRRFLYENGFRVTSEIAVLENGKVFLIFFASYDGVPRPQEDVFYQLGEFLPLSKSLAVKKYFLLRLAALRSKIVGKERAHQDADAEREEEKRILKVLEKFHEDP